MLIGRESRGPSEPRARLRVGVEMGSKLPFAVIVEDDYQVRTLLAGLLAAEDFEVSTVADCQDARRVVKGQRPDLVLLDLRLPRGDGLDLGKWIRAVSPNTGIIILTGRSAPSDRVAGLTECADDYLTKPFDIDELRQRVRNLMRLRLAAEPVAAERRADIPFEGWRLDADCCALVTADREVKLTRMEYQLLHALVKRQGIVAQRGWLLDQIGGDLDINERTVDYHICTLRIKLRRAGVRNDAITAVRGMGYKYTAAKPTPPRVRVAKSRSGTPRRASGALR